MKKFDSSFFEKKPMKLRRKKTKMVLGAFIKNKKVNRKGWTAGEVVDREGMGREKRGLYAECSRGIFLFNRFVFLHGKLRHYIWFVSLIQRGDDLQ